MICPKCKSNIPDDSRFCPDCGTPLSINSIRDVVLAKDEDVIRQEEAEVVTRIREKHGRENERQRAKEDRIGNIIVPILVTTLLLFFLFCILMMIGPTRNIIMPILDYLDKSFPG